MYGHAGSKLRFKKLPGRASSSLTWGWKQYWPGARLGPWVSLGCGPGNRLGKPRLGFIFSRKNEYLEFCPVNMDVGNDRQGVPKDSIMGVVGQLSPAIKSIVVSLGYLSELEDLDSRLEPRVEEDIARRAALLRISGDNLPKRFPDSFDILTTGKSSEAGKSCSSSRESQSSKMQKNLHQDDLGDQITFIPSCTAWTDLLKIDSVPTLERNLSSLASDLLQACKCGEVSSADLSTEIKVILSLITNHQSNLKIIHEGFKLLLHFILVNPEHNSWLVLLHGGVVVVSRSMDAHAGNCSVQTLGCGVLHSLSSSKAHKASLSAHSGASREHCRSRQPSQIKGQHCRCRPFAPAPPRPAAHSHLRGPRQAVQSLALTGSASHPSPDLECAMPPYKRPQLSSSSLSTAHRSAAPRARAGAGGPRPPRGHVRRPPRRPRRRRRPRPRPRAPRAPRPGGPPEHGRQRPQRRPRRRPRGDPRRRRRHARPPRGP
jgi:hypothetical protein